MVGKHVCLRFLLFLVYCFFIWVYSGDKFDYYSGYWQFMYIGRSRQEGAKLVPKYLSDNNRLTFATSKHCQVLTSYTCVLDKCLSESWTISKGYHRNLIKKGRTSARGQRSSHTERRLTGERTIFFHLWPWKERKGWNLTDFVNPDHFFFLF